MTGPDSFVVAICHPRAWWPEPGAFDASVAALASITAPDGAPVEVVEVPYEEPHERRAARGADPFADWRSSQPALDPGTADAFGRIHAALALDLPVDITTLAPGLRWVQALGAGSDHLVSCRLGDAGVTLTSSAGANAVGIAEFAFGRVIEHHKRFAATRELQRSQTWKPLFGRQLAGMTLGLVGLGNIAVAVATRAKAFDMRVVATRRSMVPDEHSALVDDVFPTDRLDEMLAECDAVIAAVPDTPATRGLFDASAFAAMKPGSFFCNVGRGTLVDERALVTALESEHLSGAALDVASSEPLPAGHPVWTAPNLSLSFHNAAVPTTMFAETHRMFADNLRRFLAGEPLRNQVG